MGVILSWDRTNPGESFCSGIERLQGAILSCCGTTPGELCPGMEQLQGSHSVLGRNDSMGSHSILVWNDSRGINSVLGWNDSKGVILSWDGTTPEKSFCVGMEQLQGSHSVLG